MSSLSRHNFLPDWLGYGHYLCMTTMAPIHNEISRNIRTALLHRQKNQTDLARWLGIHPNSASRLVTGQRPWSIDYLQVIAEKLAVSVPLLTGPTSDLILAMDRNERGDELTSEGIQNLKHLMQYHSYDETSMVA
jgi:plasmid maintenance system antidote protein VapI